MSTTTKNEIDVLIRTIERALQQPGADDPKLRRALSLAAEASRTPVSDSRDELAADARELLHRGRLPTGIEP